MRRSWSDQFSFRYSSIMTAFLSHRLIEPSLHKSLPIFVKMSIRNHSISFSNHFDFFSKRIRQSQQYYLDLKLISNSKKLDVKIKNRILLNWNRKKKYPTDQSKTHELKEKEQTQIQSQEWPNHNLFINTSTNQKRILDFLQKKKFNNFDFIFHF